MSECELKQALGLEFRHWCEPRVFGVEVAG